MHQILCLSCQAVTILSHKALLALNRLHGEIPDEVFTRHGILRRMMTCCSTPEPRGVLVTKHLYVNDVVNTRRRLMNQGFLPKVPQ